MDYPFLKSLLSTCSLSLPIVLAMSPPAAAAQTYPDRPIKMVVPYPAGGSVDVLGRAVADKLSGALGQAVVADNRVGATGVIAHQIVATSAPDGYTIGMSGTSPLVLAPHQYKGLPYDSLKDFVYLSCAGTTPFVLDVHPSVPAKNVADLVAYAKANPGKLNFGSAGLGNSAHLSAELFKQVAGVDMVHVPYKGNALAMSDLIGGQIQVLFDPVQTSLPHPEMKARFAALGANLTESTPENCAAFVRSELSTWGTLMRSVGIKPE